MNCGICCRFYQSVAPHTSIRLAAPVCGYCHVYLKVLSRRRNIPISICQSCKSYDKFQSLRNGLISCIMLAMVRLIAHYHNVVKLYFDMYPATFPWDTTGSRARAAFCGKCPRPHAPPLALRVIHWLPSIARLRFCSHLA